MSLILEALRKSEAERRRGSAPDVAMELPPPSTRAAGRAPAWLWPAVAVLALLLAFAGWFFARFEEMIGASKTGSLAVGPPCFQAAPICFNATSALSSINPSRLGATFKIKLQ